MLQVDAHGDDDESFNFAGGGDDNDYGGRSLLDVTGWFPKWFLWRKTNKSK